MYFNTKSKPWIQKKKEDQAALKTALPNYKVKKNFLKNNEFINNIE